jgi:hypothetical protein
MPERSTHVLSYRGEEEFAMYEAMDAFLRVDTWHIGHALDRDRFFKALAQIVREENFNPEEMGNYMRNKLGIDFDDHDSAQAEAINACVSDACAVSDDVDGLSSTAS